MSSRNFRPIAAAIAVVFAFAVPSSASAAGNYFSITDPANGTIVNSIPGPGMVPGYAFVNPMHNWQATPFCDYFGTGLSTEAGALSVYCNDVNLERPMGDGAYGLKMEGSAILTEAPFTNLGTDSDTVNFILDTVDPVVNILTPASGLQVSNRRPTITFSGSDLNPLTFTCSLDGTPTTPCASPFTPAADLSDATHSFQVSATDGANVGTSTTVFVTVDTVAPTVNVVFPTPNAIVDSSVPEVNMAVDGATAGSFCRYDQQEYQSCSGSWLGGSLADGAHTLSVRAVDVAGNETVVVVPFFVDDSLASGPLPQSVSLTNSKGTKVKSGKFKVKAGLAVLPSDLNFLAQSCTGTVTFSIKPKVKRAKTYSKRVSLKLSGDRCKTSASITLPAKYKGKRGTLTARYHGSMLISSFRRTRSIKKL